MALSDLFRPFKTLCLSTGELVRTELFLSDEPHWVLIDDVLFEMDVGSRAFQHIKLNIITFIQVFIRPFVNHGTCTDNQCGLYYDIKTTGLCSFLLFGYFTRPYDFRFFENTCCGTCRIERTLIISLLHVAPCSLCQL